MDIEQIATSAASLIAMRATKELSAAAYSSAKNRIEQFTSFVAAKLRTGNVSEEPLGATTVDESSLRETLLAAMADSPELAQEIAAEVAKVKADPSVTSFVTNVMPGGRIDKVVNIGEAGDVHIA